MLLFILLGMAAVEDLRHGKVSNRRIAAGLAVGCLFQILQHGVFGIYYFLWNISVPVILFFLLFQMRVLGAGDIKLFSMTGSILTIRELCSCMIYSFLFTGAAAVLILAADPKRGERLKHSIQYLLLSLQKGEITAYRPPEGRRKEPFAFSVAILFGTAAALCIPVRF